MNLFRFPAPATWPALCARPAADPAAEATRRAAVRGIYADVIARGDVALAELTQRFDGVPGAPLTFDSAAIRAAAALAPVELRGALEAAATNIRAFHAAAPTGDFAVETLRGVRAWARRVPLRRVGLYVPGGSAPLVSSLLMLAIPAQLAGCDELVICTPPGAGGTLAPAIALAAEVLGISRIFGLGGAQAVAAMAVGTATVPRCDKICGPGNAWVDAAKRLAPDYGAAYDLPAGPSEALVLADATARPAWVAADLLAQAEHGPDSQVVLVTDSETLLNAVLVEVERQLALLPRRAVAAEALTHSRAVLVPDLATGLAFAEAYASEHLLLAVADPGPLAAQVQRAGSVFLGHFSPESCGDYATGPNHTLPTGGAAAYASGVSVETFTRRITFQELTPTGLQALAGPTIALAEAEGLQAHAEAARVRLVEVPNEADAQAAQSVSTVQPQSLNHSITQSLNRTWPRPHVAALVPYASARDEYGGPPALAALDANENPLGAPVVGAAWARYPDPHQRALTAAWATRLGVPAESLLVTNGSDEGLDLLVRAGCAPGADEGYGDSLLACPPTYGMYGVAAASHNVACRKVPLTADFQLNMPAILADVAAAEASGRPVKLLLLTSPNNPTGNLLAPNAIGTLLKALPNVVVVVDEAYADFADGPTWVARLSEFPNLVVLRTLSKAWGMAGLRVGAVVASAEILGWLRRLKPPYNVSGASQALALQALQTPPAALQGTVSAVRTERDRLANALISNRLIEQVFPSDANFLLVRVRPEMPAPALYKALTERGVVVRDRSREPGCANCLRISIGTAAENDLLLAEIDGLM